MESVMECRFSANKGTMNSEEKRPKNIIVGQKVSAQKAALARELRRNQTDAEKILWQRLRANRLDGWHFRRQQVIAGLIVDFYCHKDGLVIELDGEIHTRQVEYDQERDGILASLGLKIIRFPNRAVETDIDEVMEVILRACKDSQPQGQDDRPSGE